MGAKCAKIATQTASKKNASNTKNPETQEEHEELSQACVSRFKI